MIRLVKKMGGQTFCLGNGLSEAAGSREVAAVFLLHLRLCLLQAHSCSSAALFGVTPQSNVLQLDEYTPNLGAACGMQRACMKVHKQACRRGPNLNHTSTACQQS